jgi:hypothetical protein
VELPARPIIPERPVDPLTVQFTRVELRASWLLGNGSNSIKCLFRWIRVGLDVPNCDHSSVILLILSVDVFVSLEASAFFILGWLTRWPHVFNFIGSVFRRH